MTVNDYLSKRDSEWMGPLYMFHGSSVDCIDKHQPNSPGRRDTYNCDITFGTNNEFGSTPARQYGSLAFDLVQRKHYYAIVDEVDSVLIDDAVHRSSSPVRSPKATTRCSTNTGPT